jgi:hypothetical protein
MTKEQREQLAEEIRIAHMLNQQAIKKVQRRRAYLERAARHSEIIVERALRDLRAGR